MPEWCSARSDANSSAASATVTVPPSGAADGPVVASTSVSPGIWPNSSTAGHATPACRARLQASASWLSRARELIVMGPAAAGCSRASAHSRRARPDPRVSRP